MRPLNRRPFARVAGSVVLKGKTGAVIGTVSFSVDMAGASLVLGLVATRRHTGIPRPPQKSPFGSSAAAPPPPPLSHTRTYARTRARTTSESLRPSVPPSSLPPSPLSKSNSAISVFAQPPSPYCSSLATIAPPLHLSFVHWWNTANKILLLHPRACLLVVANLKPLPRLRLVPCFAKLSTMAITVMIPSGLSVPLPRRDVTRDVMRCRT